MPTKEQIATAYHEAGHAVVSWRSGIKVKHVSIIPNEARESAGYVQYKNIPRRIMQILEAGSVTPAQRELIENHIVMGYAGSYAERIFKGRHNHRGAQSDYSSVVDLADRLCGSHEEVEAYLAWLAIKAFNTVNSLWPQITVVAQTLLDRRELTGDELHEVIINWNAARLADRTSKVIFTNTPDETS